MPPSDKIFYFTIAGLCVCVCVCTKVRSVLARVTQPKHGCGRTETFVRTVSSGPASFFPILVPLSQVPEKVIVEYVGKVNFLIHRQECKSFNFTCPAVDRVSGVTI